MSGSSLLYPFTLGMMAAVNPCGFPLLPAYLELFVGPAGDDRVPVRAVRAIAAAACATVGFLVLFGALGLVTQLGWSEVADRSASGARYVMVVVGVAMVVLGGLTLARRTIKVPLPQLGTGSGLRRPVGLAVFGFSYGVASIGCALPLFIGGVASSFGHHGSFRALADLLAYGLGMATILGTLALGIAVLGRGAGRHLRVASRWVTMAGGAILVAVGGYLTWYWVDDIVAPGRSFALQRWINRIQIDISNPLDEHAELVGAVLGAALIVAVVAGGLVQPAGKQTPVGPAPGGGTRPDPTLSKGEPVDVTT
ncbi:MAG TPA: cytochrome c biogenesis protein CcdA [Acidimicrobiales bacterium]|nr:cytochrome c biogenesis protein CcdA [Acidimicrobiales bacterium]